MQSLIAHFGYIVTVFLMVTGLFIVIARGNLIKKLVGLSVFQTSVYLLYIIPGKLLGGTAPILAPQYQVYSNPLPQHRHNSPRARPDCPHSRELRHDRGR